MSILDSVKPTLFMARNKHSKSYATSRSKAEAELYLAQSGFANNGHDAEVAALYSRESVESIIEAVKAEIRKEVLLEAVEEFASRGMLYGYTVAAALRRMAESDKGGNDE
jgi:hypothetical protein